MAKKNEIEKDFEPKEDYETDNFIEALKIALSKAEVLESILIGAKAWASKQPDEIKFRFRALHLSVALAIIIFIGVGIMAYLQLISKDVTAGLLGSLIGYWYGQNRNGRK